MLDHVADFSGKDTLFTNLSISSITNKILLVGFSK